MTGVDVRDEVLGVGHEAVVPGRFREPMIHVVPKAMPEEWTAELGRALFAARLNMLGDDLDRLAPELMAGLRMAVVKRMPEALGPCGVADFDLLGCEITAVLHHHGGSSAWFSGVSAPNWERRRIGFELTLRTEPRMFAGGELEMVSGEVVEPDNARLVWMHPLQAMRVREVECWSSHPMHGRWSIWGWLLGAPPEGWAAIVERLRIHPES